VTDVDLFFTTDPTELFKSDRVRAAPNNHTVPPPQIFKKVLEASGLSRAYRPGIALIKNGDTRETHINNISAGIVAVPTTRSQVLAETWKKCAEWLIANRDLLAQYGTHIDQIGFALAMEELGEDVEFLPPQINTILHLLPDVDSLYAIHLTTGHIPEFPDRFGEDRRLLTDGLSDPVTAALARLNSMIRVAVRVIQTLPSTRDHFEKFLNPGWRRDEPRPETETEMAPKQQYPEPTMPLIGSPATPPVLPPQVGPSETPAPPCARHGKPRRQKIIVGTGWWSDDSPSPWLIGNQATKTPEFFSLWLHLVRRYIDPADVIVVDMHAPLKPSPELRREVKWLELDQNYGSPNDIRCGTIHTKYCGHTRSTIMGAMFALCCDADIYCYVEQDCVIRGKRFLDHALAGREPTILVGAPTEGGVGLGGQPAAPMYQNSLVVVGRSSLERYIRGLTDGLETDGELSPEVKLVRDCAPVEVLAIPYGRSRPIDFDAPVYYVEHLNRADLHRFLVSEGLRADQFGLSIA
jgi:hypothetical protein